MNKVYIIAPLIGLLIFGGFYYQFTSNYDNRIKAEVAKIEQEKKDRAARDIANRELAIKAAIETQAKRKQEREKREAAEEAKRVARQDAEDARLRAYDERNKLRDQVGRLKKDEEELKAAIAKVAEEKKRNIEEEAFLKTFVVKAQANQKYYYDLLDKIAQAEAARAAAEAAAAAAAKKG
jgi:colicin import membrane protein